MVSNTHWSLASLRRQVADQTFFLMSVSRFSWKGYTVVTVNSK
jgi:hypothetical protein